MTAWTTISESDLEDYQVAALVEALRTAALGSSQDDPFSEIASDRIAYIRNRIAGRVTLSGTANTVPPELKAQTCWLILESMNNRLGIEPNQSQRDMIKRAYDDLKIAGTKDFAVSSADDAETPEVETGGGFSLANTPTGTITRQDMAGL